ncbi:hypothetical protein [Paenibacillus lautus]|uniref:hypothetical protein n=1 Tax=Paenibacillus lautus TaxID=1401 RepID=UPI003D28CCB1
MMKLTTMVRGLTADKVAHELIRNWEFDEGTLKFWRASSWQSHDHPVQGLGEIARKAAYVIQPIRTWNCKTPKRRGHIAHDRSGAAAASRGAGCC